MKQPSTIGTLSSLQNLSRKQKMLKPKIDHGLLHCNGASRFKCNLENIEQWVELETSGRFSRIILSFHPSKHVSTNFEIFCYS
jgi:hypothetical protein